LKALLEKFEKAALERMKAPFQSKDISDIAKRIGFDPDYSSKNSAYRVADKLIQERRKKGEVSFVRRGRLFIWSEVRA